MSEQRFPDLFKRNSIIAMAISRTIFARHDGSLGSEHEGSDLYVLQRDPARAHPLRPRPSVSLIPSLCIFAEKQGLEEKPRVATIL